MGTKTDIQSNLPLTEATYFILLSLAPVPRHGYAIMKDVRQLSHERVTLSTGTLYSALKRLLEQGWIRRAVDAENTTIGRERKSYCLTQIGRGTLEAEVQRLQSLVSVAQVRRLGNVT
jgi:DNA-binding PadR family transcriptional regulator